MIRILLADAQLLVREGLKTILNPEDDLQIVCEAENRYHLIRCIKKEEIDVAIIDYSVESHFMVSDVGLIKELSPQTQVLVISSDNSRENIYQVIDQGTQGYLTKECDREEVLDAVRATARKEKFFCSKIIDIVLEKEKKQEVESFNCEPASLTIREQEVLALIAEGSKTNQIAEFLSLSVHTINTHRKNIIRKLGVKSTAELMRFALSMAK